MAKKKIKEIEELQNLNSVIGLYGGLYAGWYRGGGGTVVPPPILEQLIEMNEILTSFLENMKEDK